MPYQITLPDGSIGMIDDSVPKDRAMEAAQAAYEELKSVQTQNGRKPKYAKADQGFRDVREALAI